MAKFGIVAAVAAIALVAAPVMAGDIINGDFAGGNTGWTTNIVNGGITGSAVFGGGTATVTGPDGGAGPGYVEIFQDLGDNQTNIPDKLISFDLVSYSTVDVGFTPAYDSPYVSVNGQAWGLNSNETLVPGLIPGSGTANGYSDLGIIGQGSNLHYELLVPGGCINDVRLALGVDSRDNGFGPGVATFDNVMSECVPEPTTAALLLFGTAALIRRRR
jgi:hypothetical protein